MSGVKDQKVADITPGDFLRIKSTKIPENVPQAIYYADRAGPDQSGESSRSIQFVHLSAAYNILLITP